MTAALNVVLSVALAEVWGIPGTLLATAVSRVVTGAWFEPWVLLRRHIEGSFGSYVARQLRAFVLWAGLALLVLLLQDQLALWPSRIAVLLVLFLAPVVAWLAYRRTAAFADLSVRVRTLWDTRPTSPSPAR